jgi:hypothetical protein
MFLRLRTCPPQSGLSVTDCSGDRLVDFVGNRSREPTYRRFTVRMRQLHLYFAVAPFFFYTASSALLLSVKSSTMGTPSFPPSSNFVAPTSTGTRLPFVLKYSFSICWAVPVAFKSAMRQSSA